MMVSGTAPEREPSVLVHGNTIERQGLHTWDMSILRDHTHPQSRSESTLLLPRHGEVQKKNRDYEHWVDLIDAITW
jgi:hypothetical protein